MNRFNEAATCGAVSIIFSLVFVAGAADFFGFMALLTNLFGWLMFIEGVVVHWMFKHD